MRWVDTLPDTTNNDLATAADWLIHGLRFPASREISLRRAAAIIRNNRKAALAGSNEIKSERCPDYPESWTTEKLLWDAVASVAHAGNVPTASALHLRHAEAALRTVWKRGQS